MEPSLERQFLDFSASKLEELSKRIHTCLGMLQSEQVWARGGGNENAIGNLVLHLCGNVRQWIVAGVGEKPDIRQRDAEFAATGGLAPSELATRLGETVAEATRVIRSASPEELIRRLAIQGYDVSKFEAIYHVVEHFSMHTGQILFITKMLTGADLGFYRHLQGAAAQTSGKP